MDFKTKRSYRKKSIIYLWLSIILLSISFSLFFIGAYKQNINIIIFTPLLLLICVYILYLASKFKMKRRKYLNDIKLYRQYNFLHIIIHNIRKNDFVEADKFCNSISKKTDFIYSFLINELLHSNEMFLNKLGEDYLQNFLNKHNKDNIFE